MNPLAPARHASQQTVAWLRDLHRRGLLNMDPPYQRRSVWNLAFRQYFVETVLLQYPSPAIFLYRTIAEDTGTESFSVVDGKQRLETLFRFADDDFALSDRSQIEALRGTRFSQIGDYKAAFWSYQITIEFIPSVEENILNNIFDRINRNTIRLTPQELRHARFSGRFIVTAERLAEYVMEVSPDVPRIVPQSRQQMKDVELVADLLLLLEDGPRGRSIADVDAAFSERDEEWDHEAAIERRFRATFEALNDIFTDGGGFNLRTSRLRNQADYYSLFGAADSLLAEAVDLNTHQAAYRLASFLLALEDDARRDGDATLTEYYGAARSASNDTGPRRQRMDILRRVLAGEIHYTRP
jgi:Protein of unknown function DUF262